MSNIPERLPGITPLFPGRRIRTAAIPARRERFGGFLGTGPSTRGARRRHRAFAHPRQRDLAAERRMEPPAAASRRMTTHRGHRFTAGRSWSYQCLAREPAPACRRHAKCRWRGDRRRERQPAVSAPPLWLQPNRARSSLEVHPVAGKDQTATARLWSHFTSARKQKPKALAKQWKRRLPMLLRLSITVSANS